MKYADRITFDPEQCGGRPCIRHYRLRVKDVLDMLAGGATEQEILADYEFLQKEDSAPASNTRHNRLTIWTW